MVIWYMAWLTFQHTDRQPATQGLSGPLNLTARCRSAKLELCSSVSPQRVLDSSRVLIAVTSRRHDTVEMRCDDEGKWMPMQEVKGL